MTNTRSSCTSILVGKKASIDGSVMIGRNEDSKTAWPKHLMFYKARKYNEDIFFESKDNKFKLKLPRTSYQYSATPEWTDRYGIFAEDGINEYGVGMSATESAYANTRVLAADPFNTESGILEEAMVTVVLPYVKTAREGVELLGKIVQDHGAGEADGILFADKNEAWYLEIGSGHHYVAMRIPDDSYAVVANQLAIQEIDFSDNKNFITSPNLQDFAYQNKLWNKNQPFIWRDIFGTHDDSDLTYNTPRVWSGQKLLSPSIKQDIQSFSLPFIQKPDKQISPQDAQRVLSDHYQHTEYDLANPNKQAKYRPISIATTQESHLLQLGNTNTHWLAMGIAAQSVYIPFYPQGTIVPNKWTKGRSEYNSNSAYWTFKLAGTLVDRSWSKYGSFLTETQKQTNQDLARIRYQYDELIAKSKQKTKLYDEANLKMAHLAIRNFDKLISKLVTLQTADSPLMFKIDPNL